MPGFSKVHMKKFLCIIAGQRAGTTALQSALSATGKFHNFGEIFQTALPRHPGAFLDYCKDKNLPIENLFSDASLKTTTNRYINHLQKLTGTKYPLIDIKFNSWSILRQPWAYPGEQPFLMQRLKARQTAFLMISRDNIADQIMSEKIARHLGKWHNLTSEAAEGKRFTIAKDKAVKHARQTLYAERFFYSKLNKYPHFKHVTYDELYSSNTYPEALAKFFNDEFEIQLPDTFKPAIKKNVIDKAHIVENYEDVVAEINKMKKTFSPRPFEESD